MNTSDESWRRAFTQATLDYEMTAAWEDALRPPRSSFERWMIERLARVWPRCLGGDEAVARFCNMNWRGRIVTVLTLLFVWLCVCGFIAWKATEAYYCPNHPKCSFCVTRSNDRDDDYPPAPMEDGAR
jgi:hypothetical protein